MADWHPIRVVARRTGLSPHVIRAWEKRYGAVDPRRTPTNRRLYSTEDVERLSLLRRATRLGRSIGQVAGLPMEELRTLVEEDDVAQRRAEPSFTPARAGRSDGAKLAKACVEAAERLDSAALEGALSRAAVELSRPVLVDDVVVPLMKRIGEAWREGTVRVAHEHLATAVVRSFMGSLDGTYPASPSSPEIVVTTPACQLHEIGALLAAVTATAEGWRATYLGPSLPAEEIASAAHQNHARAIGLSIVYPTDDPQMKHELTRLGKLIDEDTILFVGGRAAESYAALIRELGARHVEDLGQFRRELEALRRRIS